MKKVLVPIVRNDEIKQLAFWCPGCDMLHSFTTEIWTWNESYEVPTVRASLLTRVPFKNEVTICHLYITDGSIEFLGDSQHHLAGKTVDMIPTEFFLQKV